MTKYILKYKDSSFYKNRRLDIETLMNKYDNKIIVEISDFTIKDGAIDKDWKLVTIPMFITINNKVYRNTEPITEEYSINRLLESTNPKYKLYTEEEFNNIFSIEKTIEI